MQILKEEHGFTLLEQYNRIYIRFWAGASAQMQYQIPISEAEKDAIISEKHSIGEVLQMHPEAETTNYTDMKNNLMKDYLRANTSYSDAMLNQIVQRLHKYDDIFDEFYTVVLNEEFVDHGIVEDGFTAQQLQKQYSSGVLGAYYNLIFLRDYVNSDMQDMSNNLPRA